MTLEVAEAVSSGLNIRGSLMQIEFKHAKILLLTLSSFIVVAFPVFGVYMAWNLMVAFEHYIRSFVVLLIGISCFAVSVLLFWRLSVFFSIGEDDT